jgi:hypothetical protein
VVYRTKAQAVADYGFAVLVGIANDVCCIEQSHLAKTTDRTAIAIRGKNRSPELRLMDPLLDLADHVPALDLVSDVKGLTLVVRSAHFPEREKHPKLRRPVLLDEGRVDGPVPVWSRPDEVHEWYLEKMSTSEPPVEVVVRIIALIAVEHPVRRLLVVVSVLLVGAVDRQRCRPALRVGSPIDAVSTVEKRHTPTAKVESVR